MHVAILLGQIGAEAEKVLSENEMIKQVHEAVKGAPEGALKWVLILSIVSLVGIVWLVHRQQKLAKNQVKIAAMLEEMSKQCGK